MIRINRPFTLRLELAGHVFRRVQSLFFKSHDAKKLDGVAGTGRPAVELVVEKDLSIPDLFFKMGVVINLFKHARKFQVVGRREAKDIF